MLHALISDIHGNIDALGDGNLSRTSRSGTWRAWCARGIPVGYGRAERVHRPACADLSRRRVAGTNDMARRGRIKARHFNDDAAKAARWTIETADAWHHETCPRAADVRGLAGAVGVHSSPVEWSMALRCCRPATRRSDGVRRRAHYYRAPHYPKRARSCSTASSWRTRAICRSRPSPTAAYL